MAVHNETLGAAIAICGTGGGGGGGGSVTVDSALSKTSTNPVQNKVITNALDDKATVEAMTMAEYEALTDEEKLDGTVRFITDVDGETLITKETIGLGNVDNTSDINKPVSTAQRQAIDAVTFKTVNVTGADVTITAESNTRYICGEVSTISFTPSASGLCDVRFTSGASKAILTLPNTVKMPDGFKVDVDTIYEINILDGVYGVVASWPT